MRVAILFKSSEKNETETLFLEANLDESNLSISGQATKNELDKLRKLWEENIIINIVTTYKNHQRCLIQTLNISQFKPGLDLYSFDVSILKFEIIKKKND